MDRTSKKIREYSGTAEDARPYFPGAGLARSVLF